MMPTKKKMLFVDDRSKRLHAALRKYGDEYEVTLAANVKEALRLLSMETWDVVSLDFDLNGDDFVAFDSPDNGMRIIEYVLNMSADQFRVRFSETRWVIHSKNKFGAGAMWEALKTRTTNVWMEEFTYE